MKRLQLFVIVSSPADTAGGPCWEGAMVCMCRCVCTSVCTGVQVCDVYMCVHKCVQVCKCVYTDVYVYV